ncbi:ABC transporter substrate-binding protein [Microbacterium sp. EST19A]|uniref:ABC transporter substrate-binding protein n=1 Tax=Microbacterium sp. EST19A TaxID=2862681 RepID=UPI001CBEBCB9|nr:ABC transporter substrate-binding protein [Microbacterium sp. EST19A]
MHRIAPVVAFVAIAATLTACSGGGTAEPTASATPEKGGTITVAGIPPTIDPVSTSLRAAGMPAAQACEGLFASTAELDVAPGLVEDWSYDEDAKTYEFTLREGVPFHDGTELTSADVVASLQRYAESAPGAIFGGLVETVTAVDDYTVNLVLTQPSGAIPALLATPDTAAYIMSADSIAGKAPADALQSLNCTGPYKLDSYVPDQSIELSRFDDYASRTEESDGAAGAKVAYADTITFVPSTPANVSNLLVSGQADIAPNFPLDQVTSVEGNSAVTVNQTASGGFPLMQFNTRNGILADETLRQALQAALDDTSIMAAIAPSEEYVDLNSSLLPEGSPWYSEAGADAYNAADIKLSKKLQEEAGYNGEEIVLLYQAADAYTPVIVEQLTDAGFNVKAELLDSAAFTAARGDDTKWNLFMSGGSSYGDPLTVVFLGENFPGWWNTPEKQDLMEQLTAGATQEERKAVWDDLQGLIYEQVPFVRFGGRSQIDVTSSNIAEYPPARGSARGFYNVVVAQ